MSEKDIEAIITRLDSIESLLRHVLAELQGQRAVPVAEMYQRPLPILTTSIQYPAPPTGGNYS